MADGTVPGQRLVYIVSEKKADSQRISAVFHQFAVGVKVAQLSDQTDFEKHQRVYALLALSSIIFFGFLVEKP